MISCPDPAYRVLANLPRSFRVILPAWIAWAWIAINICLLPAQEPAEMPPSREALKNRYEQAVKFYSEKKWHAAAEEFRWLSTQAPGTPLGSYAIVYEADCLMQDNESQRAMSLLSNWLESPLGQKALDAKAEGSPERSLAERARLRLAELAYRLGNPDLAISNYQWLAQSSISPEPKGVALLALGRHYQSQKDNAQAEKYFSECVAQSNLASYHDAAKFSLLMLQLSEGKGERVVQELRTMAEATPSSPVSSAAAFQLGQLWYSQSQFDLALSMYEKVIAADSERASMPLAYIGSANCLYQLGRKDEARVKLQAYLDAYPEDSRWTQQAHQFIRWQLAAGEYSIAQQWLDRLQDIGFAGDEEKIIWLRTKSLWERASGDGPAAVASLRSAIELATAAESSSRMEPIDLQKELLAILLESNCIDEAKSELRAWIEVYRQNSDRDSQNFFAVKRLELMAQQRDWSQLAPLIEAWLQENPDQPQKPEVLLVRAQCEIGTARIDEARVTLEDEVFKLAATADRLKAQAMWLKGETYFLQKDYVAAVGAYSMVVQKFQDSKWSALAMLQAGKCYEIAGQPQDAIQLYEQALKLSPVDTVKKQLEARLSEAKQTRTSSLTPASRNTIPSR